MPSTDYSLGPLEPVARGGMSTVYRGHNPATGAPVAVKVLAGTDLDLERFEREAQVLAELDHPFIVRYVAHGHLPSGEPYLAMEWLEGETLAHRLARGPLEADETVLVARRTVTALAAAHATGVVHRDLKPSNLFLTGGQLAGLKLVDFGVARVIDGRMATLTRTGIALGTPAYMAPEQVRGSRLVDGRTDLFALGAVLHECLTGRPAFAGPDEMAIMSRILSGGPPPLPDDAPPDLARLIDRLLEKEPARRPGSAAQVLALLDGVSVADDPPGSAAWFETRTARVAELAQLLDVDGVLAALTEGGGTPVDELARRAQMRCLSDGTAALFDLGVNDLAGALGERVIRAAAALKLPDDESSGHAHRARASRLAAAGAAAAAVEEAAAAARHFTAAGDEARAAQATALTADLAADAGDPARARTLASPVAASCPRARLALGRALLALGRAADARIELKRVPAAEPWIHVRALTLLARAALRAGHAAVAENEARAAAAAAARLPHLVGAANELLAEALRKQGREAEALAVQALSARRGV